MNQILLHICFSIYSLLKVEVSPTWILGESSSVKSVTDSLRNLNVTTQLFIHEDKMNIFLKIKKKEKLNF